MSKTLPLSAILEFLKQFAPPSLAEEWDNVGLLVGDANVNVAAVMTCLTLTPDVADEAIQHRADLVVSHHPLFFHPIQRLTTDKPEGKMLLELIAAGIAVYSPHTGYDSAREGINQQLAELLGLEDIGVLRPRRRDSVSEDDKPRSDDALSSRDTILGGGRFGTLPAPTTLDRFCQFIKRQLDIAQLQYVGSEAFSVQRVGIACGAAAEFLDDAIANNCQVLLTGEARFHACLEARSRGIALILPGHYATERLAMENLAQVLADQFSSLTVWASHCESDPIKGTEKGDGKRG